MTWDFLNGNRQNRQSLDNNLLPQQPVNRKRKFLFSPSTIMTRAMTRSETQKTVSTSIDSADEPIGNKHSTLLIQF